MHLVCYSNKKRANKDAEARWYYRLGKFFKHDCLNVLIFFFYLIRGAYDYFYMKWII